MWRLLGSAGLMLAATAGHAQQRAPELAYGIEEGRNLNAFVRDGAVAAHLLLRSGTDPRILVAFPAGNSGVGLWFEPTAAPANWTLDARLRPTTQRDAKDRTLNGIVATASITAASLRPREAVLSNVRFLRDYQAIGRYPAELKAAPRIDGDRIVWQRDRIDGAPGYALSLRVLEGQLSADGSIRAGAGGRIRLEITAVTGETPLTGLTTAELLNDRAAADPAARNALRFLSYREKFLAGSWRFDTYFGRDTLMSLRLLMPALRPPAIEAGLHSVLARLNPGGEVAHEEALGEFAILERREKGLAGGDAATLDYAMVDDDFLLAPVAATYLLDRASAGEARTFIDRPLKSEAQPGLEESAGKALVRNLRFVVERARAFAADPRVANLVAIKDGRDNGQWRDSDQGLGRGRYAYDVNAVFVPAALDAAQRLLRSGRLDPALSADDRKTLAEAGRLASVWREHAPRLFNVAIPNTRARSAIDAYAKSLGVPAAPALASLGQSNLAFHAISLEADGTPVPIVHSDEGFALLFTDPAPALLERDVAAMMRPFPAGLMTDIGLLVANAAQADARRRGEFGPERYHGAVVWSWQQALLAAGLERQLGRRDLPASTRALLTRAQADLWRVIRAGKAVQNSELWSWAYRDGAYRVVAFGAGRADVDESNAAQLWSTVYLAVQPPR
ncbi:hypothetical protein COC42_07210 [Sphingomonas spermidinifaciens]|uniref:Lipoprotein n=1 Tax=Sphingomonas spermidinifaciens TaxID=1141889 RepID=A0A2A4B8V8_9SPHN|nr:hypothetical protein [Sphingomonas spermidinifaciens]PCD04084.1 hypothetical protein COC42_07210 [Sphingomonas spermidinifaciens]